MSMKIKVPLVMLVSLTINLIVLFLYVRFYAYNRIEDTIYEFKAEIAGYADEIAETAAEGSYGDAVLFVEGYTRPYDTSYALLGLDNADYMLLDSEKDHAFALTEVRTIHMISSEGISDDYLVQVQKYFNVKDLQVYEMVLTLLYLEIGIMVVMFLIIGVVLSVNYAQPITKLEKRMEQYRRDGIAVPESERKDEIGKLENEFSHLSSTLNEEKQLQNRIIASISHDIKTPLTSVLGYTERVVNKDIPPEKQKQYLGIIYNQARDIESIVQGFDEYLLSTMPAKDQSTPYTVEYICRMLEDEYREQLEHDGVTFSTHNTCGAKASIQADLFGLRRVFANIIGNSLRHSTSDKLTIRVNARCEEDSVWFAISDNGNGVNEADLAHVFEPFYTSDQSRRVSGLGLSICKSIIERHAGTITIENNQTGGATTTITLPIIIQ